MSHAPGMDHFNEGQMNSADVFDLTTSMDMSGLTVPMDMSGMNNVAQGHIPNPGAGDPNRPWDWRTGAPG